MRAFVCSLLVSISCSGSALGCRTQPKAASEEPAKPEGDAEPTKQAESAEQGAGEAWPIEAVELVDDGSVRYALDIAESWRLPVGELGPRAFFDEGALNVAVQRGGIEVEGRRVADSVGIEADPELASIEELEAALEATEPQGSPAIRLFMDPELPTSTFLRVLATARRAGWRVDELPLVAEAGATRSTQGLSLFMNQTLPPPPPDPRKAGAKRLGPEGWFTVVVDVGAEAIRVGTFVPTMPEPPEPGTLIAAGHLMGEEPVEWREPEPRGPDELERLEARAREIFAELEGVAELGPPMVHLSAAADRPTSELIAVAVALIHASCPPDQDWSSSPFGACAVGLHLRAGPPPAAAIDEIFPKGALEAAGKRQP